MDQSSVMDARGWTIITPDEGKDTHGSHSIRMGTSSGCIQVAIRDTKSRAPSGCLESPYGSSVRRVVFSIFALLFSQNRLCFLFIGILSIEICSSQP